MDNYARIHIQGSHNSREPESHERIENRAAAHSCAFISCEKPLSQVLLCPKCMFFMNRKVRWLKPANVLWWS